MRLGHAGGRGPRTGRRLGPHKQLAFPRVETRAGALGCSRNYRCGHHNLIWVLFKFAAATYGETGCDGQSCALVRRTSPSWRNDAGLQQQGRRPRVFQSPTEGVPVVKGVSIAVRDFLGQGIGQTSPEPPSVHAKQSLLLERTGHS
ncbi:hypothetical protein BV898_19559 [Hypsibius exemplaris]|uniref:Uncharacterized protein n=1 Tax=Hypsibius exemplaris TaxID=2072580 RepID=A0A9X6NJU4_HYPEX|nr:hypothetical protein BV898_19559 [Hypsibius exemplaris]